MVQVANGLQRAWVGSNRKYVPPTKAQEGIEQDDQIVLSQLTRARQEEAAAREAAIAALTQALNTEVQDRTEADRLAEDRLQQAIEGVSKRTVADRYDGTAAPTPADVPGVDTAAPATDWHSWFLWDQGAGNAATGFYYFAANGTPTRVPGVDMAAGLLTFVDNENSWWLMVDDPTGGAADFIPWGRSTDLGANGPIYIGGNIVRLAFQAGVLATRVNPDTGEVELTVDQVVLNRITNLETDVDDLQTRTGAIETEQVTQNERLNRAEQVNDAQGITLTGQGLRLTANEQLDQTQNGRLDILDATAAALRTDVDSAIAENTTQNTQLTGLRRDVDVATAENVTQNTALAGLRTDVNQAISENNTQNTLLTGLRTDVDTATTENATQNTLLTGLRRDVDVATAENVTQNTALAGLRTDVDTATAENNTQNALLAGLRTDTDKANADNTAQDRLIAQLQQELALKQTLQQVIATYEAREAVNNPIISLNETDPRVTRTVELNIRHSDGRTYTRTTFTIELGSPDYARTRLSESAGTYEEVESPQGAYPGTAHILAFLSTPEGGGDGSVPNGVIDAWFHKGYRSTITASAQPTL